MKDSLLKLLKSKKNFYKNKTLDLRDEVDIVIIKNKKLEEKEKMSDDDCSNCEKENLPSKRI